ncbi:MAG: periplasmic heavy metal sensor [Pseudomonadota bacterium]
MADPDPTPPPTRSPGWMRLVLIVSLAVNLLIVGMVGGAVLSGGGPGGGRDAARDTRGSPFIRALEPDERRQVMRDMVRGSRELRESRETLRVRFDALLVAIRAEDFDKAEVETLLQQQREISQKRNQLGELAILERVSKMSLEERRAYADRLEAAVKQPRPR